ncbi:epimerase [Verrucomicrobia bacterium LW23]|nr:epimerase [Verrucomicrobia bacterium LW23]
MSLDHFGSLIIKRIRNATIEDWARILDGRMKGATATHVQSLLTQHSPDVKDVIEQLLPKIVDTAIHHMLWTIEQENDLKVMIKSPDGIIDVKEESDGLAGELYGEKGWIARHGQGPKE